MAERVYELVKSEMYGLISCMYECETGHIDDKKRWKKLGNGPAGTIWYVGHSLASALSEKDTPVIYFKDGFLYEKITNEIKEEFYKGFMSGLASR